jgi:hypothetical protein
MKVLIRSAQDKYDYRSGQSMLIDDKEMLSIYDLSDCPEDARIGRDLVDCNRVFDFMKRAYLAGKNGEELLFSEETVEWDDL